MSRSLMLVVVVVDILGVKVVCCERCCLFVVAQDVMVEVDFESGKGGRSVDHVSICQAKSDGGNKSCARSGRYDYSWSEATYWILLTDEASSGSSRHGCSSARARE